MRVLFSAPRKTGNAYLRCLLASAYGLQVVSLRDAPRSSDRCSLAAWLDALPEDSLAGSSLACSPELRETAGERNITLIGVIRHPFDLFLSNFEVAQHKAARDKRNSEDVPLMQALAGMSLEDPAVREYARNRFAAEVSWLRDWHDGAAMAIRYEQLLAAPREVMDTMSSSLGLSAEDGVVRAIDVCQAENLVISRPARGRRMPAVPPGAWRERLPAALQSALREQYSDDVLYLGYESV